MPDFEFQPYLDFVQRHYSESQGLYTPTDAVLPLKVQSVEKDDRVSGEQGNDQKSSQKLEQFLVLDGLRKYALGDDREHVLLAGRPGSGKSMALKQLAVALAKKGQVPVLIQLKGNVPILDAIADELENGDLEFDAKDIKRLLRHQKLILLLDGINETKDDLRETLQPFRERYQTTPMIFTTRDLAIGGDLGIGKRFEMKPLSPEQLREFVGKYLPGQGERLLKQLSDRLREISETPLLLKMLCDVFDPETDQIPQNKGELFREFDRKYDQFKGLPAVSADFRRFKSEVLQHLAFVMMTGDEGKPTELELTIDRQKAEKAIEDLVTGRVSDPGAKAKEWLEDLLEHHLLQVATDDRRVEFRHQLFQEYYAAEALLVMFDNKHPDVIEKERFQHFYLNYLKWTETITIVLSLMKTENAVDVVKWALVVDLILGARLAGEVRSGFQERTVGSVKTFAAPTWLRVELLGKTKSEIALPELLKVLEHSDSGLRGIAAEAIGEIGSESAIPDLLKAIEDSDLIEDSRLYGLPVCFIAAHAIGKIGSEAAIPVLLKALEHPCDDVYRSAAIAIGKIGSEIAIQGLLKALEHSESYVRMTAAEAIGKIGSKAAIPGLLKVLEDSDPDVCRNAAWALGEIGSEAAIPALLKAMKGSDVIEDYGVPMYFVAANAIGKIGSEAAIPALLKAIEDSDANVRISAAMAIKKIGFEATIPACVKAIEDSDSDVDWSEADVISINEEAFIEILLEIVEHSDLHARSNAVNSLSNYKNDRAAHILSNLLQLLPTESGKEAFQAIQAIQINCKFYNYEIQQQAKLKTADRASLGGGGGDRSPNIIVQGDYIAGDKIQGDKIEGDKYNIDRIGNLNTGTVNIHGNQNGEQ